MNSKIIRLVTFISIMILGFLANSAQGQCSTNYNISSYKYFLNDSTLDYNINYYQLWDGTAKPTNTYKISTVQGEGVVDGLPLVDGNDVMYYLGCYSAPYTYQYNWYIYAFDLRTKTRLWQSNTRVSVYTDYRALDINRDTGKTGIYFSSISNGYVYFYDDNYPSNPNGDGIFKINKLSGVVEQQVYQNVNAALFNTLYSEINFNLNSTTPKYTPSAEAEYNFSITPGFADRQIVDKYGNQYSIYKRYYGNLPTTIGYYLDITMANGIRKSVAFGGDYRGTSSYATARFKLMYFNNKPVVTFTCSGTRASYNGNAFLDLALMYGDELLVTKVESVIPVGSSSVFSAVGPEIFFSKYKNKIGIFNYNSNITDWLGRPLITHYLNNLLPTLYSAVRDNPGLYPNMRNDFLIPNYYYSCPNNGSFITSGGNIGVISGQNSDSVIQIFGNNTPTLSANIPTLFSEVDTAFYPEIKVTDGENGALTCKYYVDSETVPRDTKTAYNTATTQTITFNAINMSNLSEGVHTLKFEVSDGIAAPVISTVSIKVDKSAPTIGTVNITPYDTSITITGSATDNIAGLDNAYPYRYIVGSVASSWITTTSYTQYPLSPNSQYTIKFEAKDLKGHIATYTQNKYTKAQMPLVTVSNAKSYSLDVVLRDSNPSTNQYQIICGTQYVTSTGTLTATPTWITLTYIPPDKKITVTGLLPNTTYTFQVKAKNNDGIETAFSAPVSSTTMVAPPANFRSISTTQKSVTLAWDSVIGATAYDIEAFSGSLIMTNVTSPFVFSGLSANTAYNVRVRSRNVSGAGNWSAYLYINTLPDPPAAPSGLTAVPSSNSMSTSWNTATGATGYDIEVDGTIINTGTSTTYNHTGLSTNTSHTYKVRAKNTGGVGAWSTPITKYTLSNTPNNGSISAYTNTSVSATWAANGNPTGVSYILAAFVGTNTTPIKQNLWTTSLSDTITGLGAQTTYNIKVKAKNSDNAESPWYQIGTVTTHPNPPATPPGDIAATATSTSVKLSWSTVEGAAGYEVERDGAVVDNGTATTFTHSSLSPVTQHTYRVRAKNPGGAGPWSTLLTKTTLPQTPGTPVVSSTNTTSTSVTLTWAAVQGADGYEIKADGFIVNTGTDTTYTHTGLIPGTEHTYSVRSRNDGGKSSWSTTVTKSTTPNIPAIPANINTQAGQNEITLLWTRINGAAGYDIEVDGQVVDNGTATSYLHSGLTPHTRHTYRVRAKNAGGVSDWSTVAAVSTQPQTSGVPSNLKAQAAKNSLTITWDVINGAQSYDIEADGITQTGITGTQYIHTSLTAGTEHTYRVRAVIEGVAGEWSGQLTKSTLPNPPSVPANTYTSAQAAAITLVWEAAAGAEEYDIEADGNIIENCTGTSYIDSGLNPGTSHSYRVRAKNAGGTSDWSGLLVVSTLPGTPEAPADLKAKSTASAITISWGEVIGADEYQLEIDGGEQISVAEAVYGHTGLQPSTQHTYRVRAKNINGYGDWSSDIAVLTLPVPPSMPENVKAKAADTSVTLTWNAVEGATGYDIEADGIVISSGASTTYTADSLAPSTQHTYRVRARNDGGASGWSQAISILTLSGTEGVPQNLSATSAETDISLSWLPVEGALGYEIDIDGIVLQSVTEPVYSHTGLAPGTAHTYRVRTLTADGASNWSGVLTKATQLNTPTNITAEATNTSITLKWDSQSGAQTYEVEIDGKSVVAVTSNSFKHEGLMPGESHPYRIRAKNSVSVSSWSEPLAKETLKPTYTLSCTQGEVFNLLLTVSDVQDFSTMKFTLVYNPEELEVVDLCSMTSKANLSIGNILWTDIRIVQFTPGTIVFTKTGSIQEGQTFTGVVNSIRFKSKKTGDTGITYSIQ
ncbi:MAG: fibronectin type III domain-containing protein [Clostridia bacterium]|nr:fibronectin type III domain-containing protein [Clostridia bacterium]